MWRMRRPRRSGSSASTTRFGRTAVCSIEPRKPLLQRAASREARGFRREPPAQRRRSEEGTYFINITHYLDEAGEMLPLPGPARKLASFITLVIEAATNSASADECESRVRCRKRSCRGTIRTVLPDQSSEILWHCPVCGHNGVITNWQNTKWNARRNVG